SLSGSCGGLCSGPTTVKVPVVQHHPTINGPTQLCMNTRYEFSIPLWPGTRYEWGALNESNAVVPSGSGVRTSNKVVLSFNTPGSKDIHVVWKNSVTLCGGDTVFTVTVVDDATIDGPTELCVDAYNTVS